MYTLGINAVHHDLEHQPAHSPGLLYEQVTSHPGFLHSSNEGTKGSP